MREEFHALEMELADFTAVLDELTKNTYVLVVAHDPTVGLSSPLYKLASPLTARCRNCRAKDEHPARAQEVRGVAER